MQQPVSYPLFGGLNLVSSPQKTPPGHVIAALNYVPSAAGYQRFRGYERFDGQPAPSEATYWRVDYTAGGFGTGAAPAVGSTLYNGAPDHFVVCAVIITSGTFAGGDAAGYFIATSYTGTITPTQTLFNAPSAGSNVATAGTITLEYNFGAATNAVYAALAISTTRSLIAAVPGSGSIRGVWYTASGDIIAIRDDAGATAAVMYKATTSGWSAVGTLTRIDFTCDTATQTLPTSKAPSNTLANASASTSDGTIRAVAITDTTGTVNTGYMLVSGYVAGSFTAGSQTIYLAGAATVLGTTTAAASSFTLPAGGRYFFINENFYGSEDLARTYMVNGVGKAAVYDGVGFASISTGMLVDTPTRIAAHRKSLFLAFPGGSLQFSQIGEPLVFDAVVGAGELGVGSDITGLMPTKSALAIFAEKSVHVLYGNDETDYQLETLTEKSGALAFTAQEIGQVIYLDNAGIRTLAAAATFGNFRFGALSELVSPLLGDYRRDAVDPIASFVVRRENQYWLVFENDAALVGYVGRKNPEFLPVVFPDSVTCSCSVEVDGIERIFFGSDDGFVYELNKGTSFDGDAIEHYIRLPFNAFGSPETDKRPHKFQLQLEAPGTVTLEVSFDFDFGSVDGLAGQALLTTTGAGAIDDLGSNESYFASQIETVGEVYLDGVAKNISAKIAGETSTEEPHTLTSATWHLTQRRLVR